LVDKDSVSYVIGEVVLDEVVLDEVVLDEVVLDEPEEPVKIFFMFSIGLKLEIFSPMVF